MKALLSKGLYGGAFVLLSLSLPLFTACSSEDSAESTNGESGGIATGATTAGHFFLDAAADDGTEYILQSTSVTDGDLNIKSNIKELPTSPYTWVFKDSYAVGVSYQQQYAGLGYCVKLTDETKPFEQIGQFQVNDRFTTYGFIDDMFVTSVSGQTRDKRTDIAVFDFWSLDDSGVKLIRSKSRDTTDIAGEGEEFTVEKMSNMRKLIAKSMYNSLQNSAQLTHMLGADARRIQALRKKAKKALEEGRIEVNVTINDLVCFAVIKALQKFPKVNSHCLGDAMRLFKTVNLGCAVDTERGLMVPAVLHAEELNILGLSKELKKVADACKKGSCNPDLLAAEAASFTVSNLGGFGVEWFTPIINVPQSAILGVGTIVPRPKDLGGGVYAFVPYMGLSLTYDHRAIDGGEATRFLKQVATEIENLEVEF